jgi:hypothetical protein
MWVISVFFYKKPPKYSNHALGEYSPNLVTLIKASRLCRQRCDARRQNKIEKFWKGLGVNFMIPDIPIWLYTKMWKHKTNYPEFTKWQYITYVGTKWAHKIPNGHAKYQKAIQNTKWSNTILIGSKNIPHGHKIPVYQQFPFPRPFKIHPNYFWYNNIHTIWQPWLAFDKKSKDELTQPRKLEFKPDRVTRLGQFSHFGW